MLFFASLLFQIKTPFVKLVSKKMIVNKGARIFS